MSVFILKMQQLTGHVGIFIHSGTLWAFIHPPDEPAELVVIDNTKVECEKCDQASEWD